MALHCYHSFQGIARFTFNLILQQIECKSLFMKHTRIITAIATRQLSLPSMILEDIVNHRTRKTKYNYPVTGIERDLYCSDLDIISTYSIQTTVKGNIELECYNNNSAKMEIVEVPTSASFLVTCVKGQEKRYKIEFSTSLN